MEERTCVLLVYVLATQDDDAKSYRAATSSRLRLHHLHRDDVVPEHLTIAAEEHSVVATRSAALLPLKTARP
jgi:hypothetical protein